MDMRGMEDGVKSIMPVERIEGGGEEETNYEINRLNYWTFFWRNCWFLLCFSAL